MTRARRTPEERFAGLPGWPYPPRYHTRRDGLRQHGVSPIHRVSWAFMENLGLEAEKTLFD